MTKVKFRSYFSGLTKDSYYLALTSLFSDISYEILYPVLPIFLTQVLKGSGSIVGFIDGVAQASQNIIQGFSGTISDKLNKRKPVAIIGYSLSALSKPFIGLSTVWQQVLGARFLDRVGAGTRSAPRDALIAASAGEENRGKAFGIEGIGDNLGAFLGPILGVILLYSFNLQIRQIFYVAFVPGLLSVVMILLVKEKAVVEKKKTELKLSPKNFSNNFWKYIAVTAIFGLGNSSNAFLILQTKDIGVSLETTIIIYAFFNLVAALVSYPSGYLSDKFGRKKILLFSFLIFIASYLGFSVSKNVFLIGFLFILYGIYQGIFRSVGKAFATDFVSPDLRASGIGWYSATIGLTGLIASIVAGELWDRVGHPSVFVFGTVFAILGTLAFVALVPQKSNPRVN
ncbi:MAG: Major facilitator superfamily [Candidatus Woesebacteria bacterium GW2011_GWA1_39_21]|uniref:Major facilitator superfamily n=1 Tax=Candidatus Woesebacteria bacterium GW2011_GWA1_39_21 TaxID=1618550 RepID=A0A0G0NCJ8_9BACT|nr:MAG: Major facilitator superfamily [Candidatus Woesebacteria bacterium GW2011_GWA1_39_21]